MVLHCPTGRIFKSHNVTFDEGSYITPERVTLDIPLLADSMPVQLSIKTNKANNNNEGDLPKLMEVLDNEDDEEEDKSNSNDNDTSKSAPHLPPCQRTPPRPRTPPAPRPRTLPPAPEQCRLICNQHALVPDDNTCYDVSSYGSHSKATPPAAPAASPVGNANASAPVGNKHAHTTAVDHNPLTYEEVMAGPDTMHWKGACAKELGVFVKMHLYELIDQPSGCKVINCQWVFKTKCGPNSKILHYKARLIAKGFTQVEGVDYNETFTPIVKFTSIQMLLALAAQLNLEIHQLDIKTAFLNGKLERSTSAALSASMPREARSGGCTSCFTA